MSNVIALPGWDYDVPVRDVPKVILAGLRAAGVKAEQGKAWRGKYPTTLDLVIDIDCPWAHKSRDGMTFASVRLLVDPFSGSLTVQRDEDRGDGCPTCRQPSIDRWLVTCRGHEENGHPDHEPGWISVEDFPKDTPAEVIERVIPGGAESRGDDSPMGHVFEAMMRVERENKARWRLAHLDQIAEQFRETGYSEEEVRDKVIGVREMAQVVLLTGPKQVGSSEVVVETVESVMEWLAANNVPASLGVNAAWDRVKNLPGCPTQALVRKAQAERKT